jgi:hypothetical protein
MVCWKGMPAKFIYKKRDKHFTEKNQVNIPWTIFWNFIQLLPNMIKSVVHTFTSVQVVSCIITERCLLLMEPYLFHCLYFIILNEMVTIIFPLNINLRNVSCCKELDQCRLCILHWLCLCTLNHFHGCNSARVAELWNLKRRMWVSLSELLQ